MPRPRAEEERAGAESASRRPPEPPGGEAPPGQAPGAAEPGAVPGGDGGRIELGVEVEPWLLAALEALASQGRVDLDLPAAMHLPLLASPRSDFITPRQLMGHTAHLGARAYEDFLRANPGSDALKVQAFLVALGADDAPGSRPVWRRAHLDAMGWLIVSVTGARDLAAGLNAALGDGDGPDAKSIQAEEAPLTPIRGRVTVSAAAHGRLLKRRGNSDGEADTR